MKRRLFTTLLGMTAMLATSTAQVAMNPRPQEAKVPTAIGESLTERINKAHPGAIKEKGLTPAQADEAAQAAAAFRLKAPAKTAYSGPGQNQEFWFVMPQGTMLGYKHGVHYCTGGDGTVRLLAEDLTNNMTARFNGAFVGGKLHTISGDLSWAEYGLIICRDHVYDPQNNWQLYQSISLNDYYYLMSQEVAVDPVTQRVYGTFLRDDYYTYDIAWVDYNTREIHRIGPAQRDYPGLGMNSQGRLFGVDMDGVLYEISLQDGTDRAIGSTGLSVRDEDDRYFYQSAECGVSDNVLYWAVVFPDGASALYAIDLETAAATKIHDFPKYTLVHCLTVPDTMADNGAPAAVANLQAHFEGTSATGTLSFTLPVQTYDGQELTGQLDYTVRADSKEAATGTAAAGSTASVSLTLGEGLHYVEVFASNSTGRSPQASTTIYIGQDTPGVAQHPQLTVADDQASVTWEAAKGAHGGYAGELTYSVTQYPAKTTQASIGNTSYTEQLALGDWHRIHYGITASNGTSTGTEATTASVAVGKPYEVPYQEDFLTSDDFLNNYTVVDANGDNVSWLTNISQQADFAVYTFNVDTHWTNIAADDWLFTPSFALKAGKTYQLTFTQASLALNKVEVKLGRGARVEAMTTSLLPVTEYSNATEFHDVSVEFTVPEDGAWNIGFHAVSDLRKSDFILDLIKLQETINDGSPTAVTDVQVTPGEKGALTGTVSFKAPTKAVGGATLTAISQIRVMRQNKVLHTFTNPAPGEQLSFTDQTAVNGYNTYTVVATTDAGDGPSAQSIAYIGIDIPQFTSEGVGLEDNYDHVTVKWTQVGTTGLNGGYVNPAEVGYAIYNVDYDTESGMMTIGDYIGTATGTDHYDIPLATDQGEQTVTSYAIMAVNEAGADEYHTVGLYGMAIGQPYALPFIQSASNSKLGNRMMWAETENNTSATYHFSADAYDGDNGSFEWAPADRTYKLALNTGKISLAGANTPTLRFAHKGTPKSRFQLTVQVQTPDRAETDLKTINYQNITGSEAVWTMENIDLSDFRQEEYIVVKFRFSSNATNNTSLKNKSLLLDAINVLDSQPYNLSIDIEAPESIVAGRGDNIDLVVHNVGENTASGYTVRLLVDGEQAYTETIDEPLASLGRKVVSVNYRPSVFTQTGRITARAELDWLYDLVGEDNEMEEEIAIAAPTVKAPQEARSQTVASGLSLSWQAPVQEPETITDSFEGNEYTDFDLCGITMEQREGTMGDWTVWNLDGDGTWNGPHGPTGHLPGWESTPLEGVSFPNSRQVCAWMVLNSQEIVGNMPVTPRTGKKMAATFDDFVQQDTWLISPQLSGREQTVTFYAAAPVEINTNIITGETELEAPEILEILVSSGGLSLNDFESLGTDTLTTEGWLDYEVDLDEGVRYLAIRNVTTSYGALALFVDDVTFERLSPLPASYNIYADEQLLQNVAAGQSLSVDGRAAQYAITALYANGDESLPVIFTDGTQGIENVPASNRKPQAPTLYDLQGRRVGHPTQKGIYVVNGRKVVR